MADNKSRGDGQKYELFIGDKPIGTFTEKDVELSYSNVDESKFGVSLKLDVDVSEALTGLKALQREAREATKALRELEEAQQKASSFPRYPFVRHPNTPPDHVKNYGKSEGYSKKGNQSGGIWFEDDSKGIADDITRSYEMGGDGE